MWLLSSAARGMSPSCKGPAASAPGAIPTVDFLLHRFGAVVKKMGVKTHDGRSHVTTGLPALVRRKSKSKGGCAAMTAWSWPATLLRRDIGGVGEHRMTPHRSSLVALPRIQPLNS
jgi:hypothetical protein